MRAAGLLLLLLTLHGTLQRPHERHNEHDQHTNDSRHNEDEHRMQYQIGNTNASAEEARATFFRLQPAREEKEEKEETKEAHHRIETHRKKSGRRKGSADALSRLHQEGNLRKQQRCEEETFEQRVKQPGCLTKRITNKFCHGTCASYFFPRMRAKKLKARFKSCAACAPRDYEEVDVVLECPGQQPPQQTVTVIKVNKCACMNVDLRL